MTSNPDQQTKTDPKRGRGWFHPGGILIGFFLGGVFVNGSSNLLHVNAPRQMLELTNTGQTPVKVHHDAAAFWNRGELTITPGQTMVYSFIDGDTMTAYPESGERGTGKIVVLKRSPRTAETSITTPGEVLFRFKDE